MIQIEKEALNERKYKIKDFSIKIREQRPLVHCITNHVTINDCANILLAVGASPTMAHHPLEVEEVTQGCHSLVCNLGATDDYEAMLIAADAAGKAGHPIVIDPVGVGGSGFRREQFWKMIKSSKISCIRGNISEIRALLYNQGTVVGVDAAEDIQTLEEKDRLVMEFSKKAGSIVVASGETDIVSDGMQCVHITSGSHLMTKVTGCGCMSTALIGAYMTIENSIEAVVAACIRMCRCGELAEQRTKEMQGGTMTFRMQLMDEISKWR